jgi:hypothetical protein
MNHLKEIIFEKITTYGQKAGRLGVKVRQLVFGFRLRSTIHADRLVLPVKLLHDHKILQRWRAHKQARERGSSIAEHALRKARGGKQRP